MKKSFSLILTAICALIVFSACGDAQQMEMAGRIHVSPDGRWIAHFLEQDSSRGVGPETVTVKQVVSICWASPETPDEVNEVKVGEWGFAKREEDLSAATHLAFSPGGKRLVVVSPFGLLFVELATGRFSRCDLKGEFVGSVCWLDDETVAYTSYSGMRLGANKRTFWRQRFDEALSERAAVHQDSVAQEVSSVMDWPLEFWSPGGSHVLFADPSSRAPRLLTVESGTVRPLEEDANLIAVSWNHAGTHVFWITHFRDRPSGNEGFRAHLLDVEEGTVLDLTAELESLSLKYSVRLEPLWTPDDKYIVCNNIDSGGFLIRPTPWEVRALGKMLDKSGGLLVPGITGQPAAGVIIMDLYPNGAAVDYEGTILTEFGNGGYSGWTVLPGGERAVSVHPGNKVVVCGLRD
ncbi:MAG: TolB-like translocation protein [Planctomycetota bacterium]|jgi:hypothetical protein